MEPNFCPVCASERKFVPAGTSKKPPYKQYTAFWSCPNNCKVPRNVTPPQPAPAPTQNNFSREPVSQARPDMNQIYEKKDLRIAKESALSSISRIMGPQTDPIASAVKMTEAADILIRYIYGRPVNKGEEVSSETEEVTEDYSDLPF